MKKILYVLVFVMCLLLCDLSVDAQCSDSELSKLSSLASKVKITYQYNEEYEKLKLPVYGSFNVYITGLDSNDIYIEDYSSLTNYDASDVVDGVVTISDVSGGDRDIYVVSNLDNCKGSLIRKITVNIPKFNYYAVSSYCDGIDGNEFVYCDKWYQMSFNKSTFLRELELYKNKKDDITDDNDDDNDGDNVVDEKDNWLNDFVESYYVYIIVGIILLIVVVIWLVTRRKKDDL